MLLTLRSTALHLVSRQYMVTNNTILQYADTCHDPLDTSEGAGADPQRDSSGAELRGTSGLCRLVALLGWTRESRPGRAGGALNVTNISRRHTAFTCPARKSTSQHASLRQNTVYHSARREGIPVPYWIHCTLFQADRAEACSLLCSQPLQL